MVHYIGASPQFPDNAEPATIHAEVAKITRMHYEYE